jgi:hypothetical protein
MASSPDARFTPIVSSIATLAVAAAVATGELAAQPLVELMTRATAVGEVPAFDNEFVRVTYVILEYPAAERRADSRPPVLYVRVAPQPGILNTQLLTPPRGTRPSWQPGVVPRAVHIELLKSPLPPRDLEEPGTDPPRDATAAREWEGGRLLLAEYRPQRYGLGTGRFPSVTTFLSEGVIDVTSRGLRRRMGVQAGDAFWFEGATRLAVVDDEPVGAAIVQLYPRGR